MDAAAEQQAKVEHIIQGPSLPAKTVAWSVGILGMLMGVLALLDTAQRHILLAFSAMLLSITVAIALHFRKRKGNPYD